MSHKGWGVNVFMFWHSWSLAYRSFLTRMTQQALTYEGLHNPQKLGPILKRTKVLCTNRPEGLMFFLLVTL